MGTKDHATHVRYGVLVFLCVLAFLFYIDRTCISKAAGSIATDLGLSNTQMGIVFAAFTVAYGLFEIPTGRWGDRFGSRGVLTRIVLWWSAFTALTGCIWKFSLDSGYRLRLPFLGLEVPLVFDSLMLLVLVRFLFGAGEAGGLPNAARVIARWFPPGARGPAQGWVNTSTVLGATATPVLAAYLIEWIGWRWSFIGFGLLGVPWAVSFYLWFRDDPAQHPAVNEAERQRIRGGVGSPASNAGTDHPPVPWRQVLTSANTWLTGGVMSCTAFVSYVYFFWYPSYLEQGRGLTNIASGWLSSLVLAGGAAGCLLGGYLADWVVRHTGSRRWSRRLIGCGGLSVAALCLVASVQSGSAPLAAGLTGLASFSAYLTLPTWWAVVTDISGKHIGAIFGLLNSLGVPGAVGSQLFFGRFVDWMKAHGHAGREQWDPGFYVCAAVLLLGACSWLWIDGTRSVVEPPEPVRA
jgi:MFS family permease